MKKPVETMLRMVLVIALAVCLAGCAAKRPPQRIQHAIQTMNRHMPEYVAEANQSLEEAKHPERERLQGIGERLAEALAALDRWSRGEEPPQKRGEAAPKQKEKR